jgi:hypothetical protein
MEPSRQFAANPVKKPPDLRRGAKHAVLYHGTDHAFAPGEIVKPGGQVRYPGSTGDPDSRVALATTNPNEAAEYAQHMANANGHLFGMVYKVDPVAPRKKQMYSDWYQSPEGYHPVGLHSFVPSGPTKWGR